MKKLFYLLTFLMFTGISFAVNIQFTDEDFRMKLASATASNGIAKNQNGNSIVIDTNNDNQISTEEAANVYELNISDTSNIESIVGILSFPNLRVLQAENCNINLANLTNMTNLEEVSFKNNGTLESITVTGCTGITKLDCRGNDLTTIDVSTLINLTTLNVSNNNLVTAFIKNGRDENSLTLGNNDTLVYVCADESQLTAVIGMVSSSCVVNSYCSLPPGGNYNTITGKIVFDAASNGIDASDVPQANVKITCSIGGSVLQTITDANGNYTFVTDKIGDFTFVPVVENPSWFTVPNAIGNFANTNNNIRTQDFAIMPVDARHDVEVVVAPVSQALPGAIATYEVVFKNKGNQIHSGQIVVAFNDVLLDFVSSSTPLIAGVGTLNLNYSNLRPLECKKFTFTVNVAPITPIDTPLVFAANIDATGEMGTQNDNSFSYTQKVVSTPSFNRIECLENSLLPTTQIGDYLHYLINFQNTGTATVNNVVIRTVFNPAQYDINSIQILDSTYPVDLLIKNNEVLYQLQNIELGGPGGHGGILLKIRTSAALTEGSVVTTGAVIFFDYAPGVATSTVGTTFQNLSVAQNSIDSSLKVYPNPATNVINAEGNAAIRTVELYDIFGRLLQTNITNATKTTIDVSQRATGTYFLKITTDEGQKVEQIEKK